MLLALDLARDLGTKPEARFWWEATPFLRAA